MRFVIQVKLTDALRDWEMDGLRRMGLSVAENGLSVTGLGEDFDALRKYDFWKTVGFGANVDKMMAQVDAGDYVWL